MRFAFHGPEMPAKTQNASFTGKTETSGMSTDGAECLVYVGMVFSKVGERLYSQAVFVCI